MKIREIYADIRCLPPVIVRIDGRNFKKALSQFGFKKPYDKRFSQAMANSAELFFKHSGLNPLFAYTFSDEVSFLFTELEFDGRIEKLDSIIPSYISSALAIELGLERPVAFDSRIIPLNQHNIQEYLIWRQSEAWRNFVSSYGYYTLLEEGMSPDEASSFLKGKKSSDIHELMFERGTNLAKLPLWQRRGIVLHKERYTIEGFNPKLNKKTLTTRSRVVQNWDIPEFNSDQGTDFVQKYIGPSL